VNTPAALHLNLHREYFAAIIARTKKKEFRRYIPYWRRRIENREYEFIQFRNPDRSGLLRLSGERRTRCGRAEEKIDTSPLFLSPFEAERKSAAAIRLGRILTIKRWKPTRLFN